MARYILTSEQQDAIGLLLDKTQEEQDAVAKYTSNKVSGEARRDACYRKLKNALTELRHTAGLPATITNYAKDLESDSTWIGRITVT